MKPPVLFIVGPTATGKSKIAVEIAKRLNGEIISADSMLVYKGMDIGTAKPSKGERKNIPHHLIDLFSPSRNFSVFDYRIRALAKIREIQKRGKLPIVAGGTGLYVRAILNGLEPQAPANFKLRKQLAKEAEAKGLASLYEKLKKKNPKRASEIKSNDERRIIRALEIAQSKARKDSPKQEPLEALGYQPVVIGITQERAVLYRNIEERVDAMFRKGLVKEIQRLKKGRISRSALQAVGYKEVLNALEYHSSLEEAKTQVKVNTRHLAKRQWTWFKRERGIQWVSWERPDESSQMMAEKVIRASGDALSSRK